MKATDGRPRKVGCPGELRTAMSARDLIRLARPTHWVKNVVVLLPVIFARRYTEIGVWLDALQAAAAFCLAASAIYIINDLADLTRDKLHPAKKRRPLASGQVRVPAAVVEVLVLLAAAAAVARTLGWMPLAVVTAYVALQLAYSWFLKTRVIVDVICIATGFVLRAMAGAVAIGVEISPWLIICTFTICLFVGFCKRYNELATLGQTAEARDHRATLGSYTSSLLTHLITLSAAVAVVGFLMYACSPRTVASGHLGTVALVYTLPLVIYAICRFAMLSMSGRFSDPMDLLLHDGPMQVTAVLWVAVVLVIVRWGVAIEQWLRGLA